VSDLFLPFTGFSVLELLLAGAGLLAAGLALLRIRVRPPDSS